MSDIFILSELGLDPLSEVAGGSLAMMGLLVTCVAVVAVLMFLERLPRVMAVAEKNVPARQEAPTPSATFTFATSSASTSASGSAVATSATGPNEELPEHVVAIIAAVVADMVGKPHRILRTRELGPDSLVWSMHGRLQHHISYRLKPRNRTS